MHLRKFLNTTCSGLVIVLLGLLLDTLPRACGYAVGQYKYGKIETFPYQVMLIGKQLWRKRILCGGTLLNERWILTAGHCTMGVTHFDVYLGAKSVEDTEEMGRVTVRSNKFIAHENFDPVTAANDIALVKLPEDIVFTSRIQPATLPHRFKTDSFTGAKVVATGWGGAGMSNAEDPMQYTELRVISNRQCAEEYDVITNGVICAQGLMDETVCSGDSGGPLVLKGTQMVVGITSFGPADGCETNIPGGFTRVTFYLDWIASKIGNNQPSVSQPPQQQLQTQRITQLQNVHVHTQAQPQAFTHPHPQQQQQHHQQQQSSRHVSGQMDTDNAV